jgi:hypothetical protein
MGTYPQIWVSSQASADLIEILADRLRFNTSSEKAQRLGQLLMYPAQRVHIAGQQTLVIAPEVLSIHWATGQQASEDEHLASVLAWIRPPSTISIHDAVDQAERVSSGIKTKPSFDRNTLVPLIEAFNLARKRRATPAELQEQAVCIRDALRPEVEAIYRQILDAYHVLKQSSLPPLPSLPRFEQREREEFHTFMQRLTNGYRFPLHDTVRMAIYGYTARKDADELMTAVLQCEDAVERIRGRLNGHILGGIVSNKHCRHMSARTYENRFQLLSTQQEVRVRERDELFWADDPRLKVCVESIQHQTGGIVITVLITEGMRSVDLPAQGTCMDLLASRPDWHKLSRERQYLSRRLQGALWKPYHSSSPPSLLETPLILPVDPLRLVEELQ